MPNEVAPESGPQPETEKSREVDRELRRTLFRMIRAADYLQDRCDERRTRADLLLTAALLIPTIQLAVGIRNLEGNLLSIMLGTSLPAFAVAVMGWARLNRQLGRDAREIDGLVNLVRETQQAYLMQELLTTLEAAEIRIRLSRFKIRSAE